MCWETQFCLFICLFCLQSSKVKCWLMGLLCSGSLLSTWSFIGTVKRHLLILATHLNVAATSRVSWPRLSSWSQYRWQDGNTRLLNHWNWMCNPSLIFILWAILMTYFPTLLRMHRGSIIKTKAFSYRFTFALGTLLTSPIAHPQVFHAPSRGAPYLWSGPPVGLITSCSVPPLWPILSFIIGCAYLCPTDKDGGGYPTSPFLQLWARAVIHLLCPIPTCWVFLEKITQEDLIVLLYFHCYQFQRSCTLNLFFFSHFVLNSHPQALS